MGAGRLMLTEKELNALQGLMHYLNSSAHAELAFDINVADSNGDVLGMLTLSDGEYRFHPGLRVN